MLSSNALNCVRGQAAREIGPLLWEDKILFTEFREVIEKLVFDENPAVRFATLYALWPSYSYNIEREWAEEKIIKIYESDIRTASFYDSKNMFFRLYPKYKERVLKIIENCFNDSDKELIEVGGHAVCEFYIQHGKFDNIMFHIETLYEKQIEAILDMAIIFRFVNSNLDLELPMACIFSKEYIRLEDDKKFLQEIVGSNASKNIVWSFIHYFGRKRIVYC